METVQVTLNDTRYASALRDLLERNGTRQVRCVEVPDPKQAGVIVVDSEGLGRLPIPLLNPERVVLITRNDPEHLAKAWNAGIRSVVFNEDPLSTAVLAIMAAELRTGKPEPRWTASHGSPSPAGSAAPVGGCGPVASPLKTAGGRTLVSMEGHMPSPKSRDRRG